MSKTLFTDIYIDYISIYSKLKIIFIKSIRKVLKSLSIVEEFQALVEIFVINVLNFKIMINNFFK